MSLEGKPILQGTVTSATSWNCYSKGNICIPDNARKTIRAVQAQASAANIAESQLAVFHIEDTKTTLIDTAILDPRICIIRVVKDEHPERKSLSNRRPRHLTYPIYLQRRLNKFLSSRSSASLMSIKSSNLKSQSVPQHPIYLQSGSPQFSPLDYLVPSGFHKTEIWCLVLRS